MSAIPAPAHVIPFRLRAGHVILTARVNGTPGRFVLDTGSSVYGSSGNKSIARQNKCRA